MKKAIAIIAYNRLRYFELVFPSIISQKIDGKPVSEIYDIYVFQDGLWEKETDECRADHEKIARLVENHRDIRFFRQTCNLGVAFHFDFIERMLFLNKKYDYVVFHEDDMILAPEYMKILDLMGDKFKDDDRVGMVSANPAHCPIPLDRQRQNQIQGKYAAMSHNWGFGLTRKSWLKRQPFVDSYLEIIKGIPYRVRPTAAIFRWLKENGFEAGASSQDYIKCCATVAFGATRIATYGNYGLPIGRWGLHFNPNAFKKMGYDRAVVCDLHISSLAELDDANYHEILCQQQKVMGIQVGYFNFDEWLRKFSKNS
jgi:hypothetical protein